MLGIYGFMGSGQLELARALVGKLRPEAGQLRIDGRRVRLRSTSAAKRAGMALVPESRRSMLFGHEPVYKNISISILERISRCWSSQREERQLAAAQVKAWISGRLGRAASCARSRAAISRRWRSPAG